MIVMRLAWLAVVGSTFMSCGMFGSETEDGGGSSSLMHHGASPAPLNLEQNRGQYRIAGDTLVFVFPEYDCQEGGVFTVEEYTDKSVFRFYNGRLYMKDQYVGACDAEVFSGTGTQLEGVAWTLLGVGGMPDANGVFPTGCPEGSLETDGDDNRDDYQMSLVLRNGQVIRRYSGTFCMATQWEEEGFAVEGCNRLVREEAEGSAVVTFEFDDFITWESKLNVNYNGQTCTKHLPANVQIDAAKCTQAWETYRNSDQTPTSEFFANEILNPLRYEGRSSYRECLRNIGLDSDNYP